MKIGVVYVDSGWILQTIATKMCEADERFVPIPLKASLSSSGIPACDAYYYVDVQGCWRVEFRAAFPGVKHVGFFTHLDKDSSKSFRPGWDQLNGIVHMCKRYQKVFEKQGWYRSEQMTVLYPSQVSDRFELRPLRLGICQRGGFLGKGDPFLFDALSFLPRAIRENIFLRIKGTGWETTWESRGITDIRVMFDEDETSQSYPAFYNEIDYLLVPSLWEGGPVAVSEALACGIPIIAADVGWVPDFIHDGIDGCFIYCAGDASKLREIVTAIVARSVRLRARVDHLSWSEYANKLENFICDLK